MDHLSPYGATLLRVSLGIIFLAHSAYLKIMVFTVAGTVGFFESMGLPAIAAYGVMFGEIAGGIALILGINVREAAIGLAIIAAGTIWAHSGAGWLFSNEGGGWEYPLFLTITCIVQALIGPGALRVRISLLDRFSLERFQGVNA